ncbi:MAG: heme biosynthesis HemY N-terminal domain-containing protein [Betaproteobacteria bacterium]
MRGLLWVVTLFALAVGVSLAAHFNDGYALLVLPPYRVELSFNLLIILGFGAFLLFYVVLRALSLTRSLPRRVREFRERRLNQKMIESFYEAVRLLFEGRFTLAMKKAADVHAANHLPALAALLAARSAQRLHEPEKLKQWVERAVMADGKMQAACLMLEAEMHIEMRHFVEAAAVLKQLQDVSGRHVAALRLELRAQQGLGDGGEVLRLARLLEKHHVAMRESLPEIKRKAHQENIRQLGSDSDRLAIYQKSIPASELDALLVAELAAAFIDGGLPETAQKTIEWHLDAKWDASLITLYGQIEGGDSGSRLARAEAWLMTHVGDGPLMLALGRMCLAQGQWDKAERHLALALEREDRREVHIELARLYAETGRSEEALSHQRAAAKMRS